MSNEVLRRIRNKLKFLINTENEYKNFEDDLSLISNINYYIQDPPLLFLAVRYQDVPILKMLLDKGADINSKKYNEETVLMLASKYGKYRATEFLLSKEIEPNFQDRDGNTALHHLVLSESFDNPKSKHNLIRTLRVLLSNKDIDLNIKNNDGHTPLMIASLNNNLEVVRNLLQSRANPNIKDDQGYTAFNLATNPEIKSLIEMYQSGDNESIQRYLVEIGINQGGTYQRITPSIAHNITSFLFRSKSHKTSKRKSHRTSKSKSHKTSKSKSHKTSKRKSHKTSKRKSHKTSKRKSHKTSKRKSHKTSKRK